MDRRPTLETRPPVLIDTIVRTLIPPGCREHVVGDLWERYRSPGSFVIDAIRTVPFVIASQIRRTNKIGGVVVQAFVMVVGLTVGSRGFKPVLVPVVAGILALALRDAYKRNVSLSAREILVDITFGAGGILASQAALVVLSPQLLLPIPGLIAGVVTLSMVFVLRLQNPNLGAIPQRTVSLAPATLDALMTEVRLYERLGRRAIHIEAVAGIALAAFFLIPLVTARNWPLRIGWALASAYGLYVAAFVSRHRVQPMPDGLGFSQSLEFYRQALIRHRGFVRTMWLWYLLPFVPAVCFIMVGSVMVAVERGRPAWPVLGLALVVGFIGLIVHKGSQDVARKLGVRIDALGAVEER
jgi:hypothetical protein